MRPTISVGAVWIGLLLMMPGIVLAEETSTDTSATVETIVFPSDSSAGATVETSVSNTVSPMPPKPTLIRESPTKPGTLMRDANKMAPKLPEAVKSKRDVAPGRATVRVNEQATRQQPTNPIPLPNVAGKRENAQEKRAELKEKRVEVRENVKEKRAELEEKRSEVRENVKERRDEVRQKMEERKSEILSRMAHQMIRRMKAAIERLDKLADRIDSRITKLKAKNIDTTKAETNISIARAKIAEAITAVKIAEGAVAGAITQADMVAANKETSVDAGKPIREALEKARQAVFAAHKAIIDAVESLKATVKVRSDLDSNTSTVGGTGVNVSATTNTETNTGESTEGVQ